jgi:uncharacterized membrane protein
METLHETIELSAVAIEALGVIIIVAAVAMGAVRFLARGWRAADAYQQCKSQIARALLLGLEFLVAADVIRTVVLEATLENITMLALLVVVRTFLSWSIIVEVEGRWPWAPEQEARSATPGRTEPHLAAPSRT